MLDGNTSPPNLLTEADLIALMEKHGIGKIDCVMYMFTGSGETYVLANPLQIRKSSLLLRHREFQRQFLPMISD